MFIAGSETSSTTLEWAMAELMKKPKEVMVKAQAETERFVDNPINFKGTNFDYIPFGAGRRMCPGINLAMPNIELPLANFAVSF
ncbi:cytochrome P450 76C1-like [Prosopis cineraria]|uniref:cytochrome P450 76C1-like n=1 Tax=Prosopis cineraria TaxID=364024 RepID=UPI0024106C16|nr:cytochrome P450 76C1-like [Prosopis cineraria]